MNNEKEIQTLKNQVNCLVYQLLKINKILARMSRQLDLQEVRQLIAENLRILESLRSLPPHPAVPIQASQDAKKC
jgi:hypothetical protein